MPVMKNITWMCAGLMLTLIAGAPTVADDTELLLQPPPVASSGKANVLFILDRSGSMKSTRDTIASYKSGTNYGGACDSNKIYWSQTGALPDCGVSTSYVDDANFHCAGAASWILGLGSFSGVMAQYRDGGPDGYSSGPKKWQTLAAGKTSEPIECEKDSGIHGDGTAGYLWARVGNDLSNEYTNDASEEISWGSAPVSTGYTVYDGNYINWKNNPVTINQEKWKTMQDALVPILTAFDNINVGIMNYNKNEGGKVTMAIKDLEANRAEAIANARVVGNSATPLAEMFYEAALYWNGQNYKYGGNAFDLSVWDPKPKYKLPPVPTGCAKNFNIYISDGVPNKDDASPFVNNLPQWEALMGSTGCDGSGEGKCLDDIAEYLYKRDTNGADGFQNVISYMIGFDIHLPIMESAAARSGGEYYQARDYEDLAASMTNIFANINDQTLSFAAPAVPVNSFNRTRNLNDIYLPVFSPQTNIHWPGNLKKYRIKDGQIVDAADVPAVDPATGFFKESAKSIWTVGDPDGAVVSMGGAAQQLPAPASRKLYTNNVSNVLTAAGNAVNASNASMIADSVLGLTGGAGEPSKTDLLDWMNGVDVQDEDNDPSTTVRNVMGDPLHAQPAAISYGGTEASPDVVVFTATNDGYLHAIDGETGTELWSFIPKEQLASMSALYVNSSAAYKNYGIDGHLVPVVTDDNHNGKIDGTDIAYLIFGLRRGGNSYYALDVTDKTAPKLLWKKTVTNAGQSWSKPVVTRVDVDIAGLNARKAVVIVGGGYDSVQDTNAYTATADAVGAGVHMLDLVSGVELWRAGSDLGADLTLSGMTRSIPSEVRVIDLTGDGFADRMYASDTGGQLLRFDITNGKIPSELVAGGVIAQLGAEGSGSPSDANNRRFYNSPDVAIFTDRNQNRRYISLSIGSGYRAHPLDNAAADSFFSIRDPDVLNQLPQSAYDSYNIVEIGDLVEVSGSVRTIIPTSKSGWRFTLPSNQKVLADSLTFDNSVFFVGFSPEANTSDPCAPSIGKNVLYRVHVANGDPAINADDLVTLPAADADAERAEDLAQGGIAPVPIFLFPSAWDASTCTGLECSPEPIVCIGVECFDPEFSNRPVRTLWTQDGIE